MSADADLKNVEVRHEKGYVDANPLVSIVVCCHNRRHLLEKTMEAIFAQQYRPVEIVVVDDGSTDGTGGLMAGYGHRVRYFRQENQGITAARNVGCRSARGEYIAFQDDDDLMPADRIVRLYDVLMRHPSAVLAFGDWAVIDAEGQPTGDRSRFDLPPGSGPQLIEDGYTAILWGNKIVPLTHTSLFRRADGERIGWFDARFFHACEDTEFFARLALLGPIVYVPEIMSYYRKGHSSLIHANSLRVSCSRFLFFEKHLLLMKSGGKDLKKRLQRRMLRILKEMALLEKKGLKMPDRMPADYLKRGMAFLGIRDRLAYVLYVRLVLPVKR